MVLPQAMAWVRYWFRVLSLKFCGKSKKKIAEIYLRYLPLFACMVETSQELRIPSLVPILCEAKIWHLVNWEYRNNCHKLWYWHSQLRPSIDNSPIDIFQKFSIKDRIRNFCDVLVKIQVSEHLHAVADFDLQHNISDYFSYCAQYFGQQVLC